MRGKNRGDISDGRPVEHLVDRLRPLFHDTELHEHRASFASVGR
jgi:hypothetical protein